MIAQGDSYVMLVASLPALGPLLSEREPPINRVRLEQRQSELDPEDRAELDRILSVLSWNRTDISDDDPAFVAHATRVIAALRSQTLREAVSNRLEIRTLVAALRRRHQGEDAPLPGVAWGYGRYVDRIRKNWGAPDFGIGRIFPWVLAARERLEAGDVPELERIVLKAAWDSIGRFAAGHEFDFEAVVFYVLRWSMIDRWARYDATGAAARFAELLDAALEDSDKVLVAA